MVGVREEPGQWKAGALALLVHALFLGLMIFGVSWQNQEQAAVEVELWSALPGTASRPPPPPAPKPEPKPEPKPAPPEPKPAPPEPKPAKADIGLKAKEAKRKEEELKKRHEEELKQQKEKLKQAEEKRKQEQEKKLQQEKQAEALRQQQEQAEAAKAHKARAAAQQAAEQKVVGDYKSRIQAKIKRFIILPPDLTGNPQAEFDVVLMPTGDVLNLKLTRSSGSSAYDSAVERAIYKAQPLPLPPEPGLFSEFRELHLKFRLNED